MLTSTANDIAKEQATVAVVKAYTPVCVRQFMAKATPEQREKFRVAESYMKDMVLEKAGFATPYNYDEPIAELADKCVTGINTALQAARTKAKEKL